MADLRERTLLRECQSSKKNSGMLNATSMFISLKNRLKETKNITILRVS